MISSQSSTGAGPNRPGAVDGEVDAEVGPAVPGGQADERAEPLAVLGLVCGRALLVEAVPQADDLREQILGCATAAVRLEQRRREAA